VTKKNTRELLLRAATDLFYKKGFSDTSIREVGTRAGVSNSLLYHYFKDKEEMLFQIISNTSVGLLNTLQEIDGKIEDPVERLREKLIQHIVVFGLKMKKESKIVVEENYWVKGKRKETIMEYERQIYEIYMKDLRELAAIGKMNEINLTVLNFSLFGTINWFFRWYKDEKGLKPEEVADNIITMLFYGFLKNN
jgi:AcrR family transcriptional regulator